MAVNLKGKKTSLDEASIYEKRNDNLTEKERFKHMTAKEKRTHFTTYYLPKVAILATVFAIVFYIVWVDFIDKADTYMRCAILNESINDGVLTEMGDNFTKSMNLDIDDYKSSFYIYYTRSDVAMQMGADAGSDLSEISSRLVASMLDSMIATPEDVEDTYLKNGFLADLSTIFSEEELTQLKDYLYIPTTAEYNNGKPYGIRIAKSSVYQSLFADREPMQKEPVFYIISNAEEDGKEYARKYVHFLFPDVFERQVSQ